jgi:hypothetical protein
MTKKVEKSQSPFRMVVQNLPFHKFDEQKKLVAQFKDTVTLGDDEDLEKTFTANVMVDLETGEEKYVQNAYSIAKAIQRARTEFKERITDVVFEIEFLGKTVLKGKPFNQFKIGYCLLEEWEQFMTK